LVGALVGAFAGAFVGAFDGPFVGACVHVPLDLCPDPRTTPPLQAHKRRSPRCGLAEHASRAVRFCLH
jgi:hypothetical protein